MLKILLITSMSFAPHVLVNDSGMIEGVYNVDAKNDRRILPISIEDAKALAPFRTESGCLRYRWDGSKAILEPDAACLAEESEKHKGAQVDKTNDDMARWVEYLTVRLFQKGLLSPSDIPLKVKQVINERRTLRGDGVVF